MAFIPELIQYPPTSPHYGENAFSSAGPFASAKNRNLVKSPSRSNTRSSTSNNYYYKSMNLPTCDPDCLPSDNVKMVTTHQVQHHSHSSPRKALLAVESSTIYIPSTSCTVNYSESENDKGDESSDDDVAIFDSASTHQLPSKSQSTATLSMATQGISKLTSNRVSDNLRALASSLNHSSVEIRPSYQKLNKQHFSHQNLPPAIASKVFSSSSPTLTLMNQDNASLYNDHEEDQSQSASLSQCRSHLYEPLLQTVET